MPILLFRGSSSSTVNRHSLCSLSAIHLRCSLRLRSTPGGVGIATLQIVQVAIEKPHTGQVCFRVVPASPALDRSEARGQSTTPPETMIVRSKVPGRREHPVNGSSQGEDHSLCEDPHRVNLYDPKWELYLEARLGWQLTQTRTGCSLMEYLWKRQEGRCVVCGQPLRIAEDYCQIHHQICRSQGSPEMADNMELLTPTVIGRSTCKEDTEARATASK